MIDRTIRYCQSSGNASCSAGPLDGLLPADARSEAALGLMRRIDELHLAHPFAGARMLRDLLRQEGHAIGRRQVATLMRRMGLTALYRKPSPASGIPPTGLSLSPARPGDHSPESGLGGRYHLHSHAARVRVSLCRPGLGESPSVGLAALQYADHGLLPRRRAGGDHAVWLPGDLQHRPRAVSSPVRSSRDS
jgi:hypothetical protein